MSQKATTDELNKKANSSDIPTQLSQLNEDETHRVVTDTEKNAWNGKQDKLTNSEFKQLDLDTPVDIWQATKADGGVGLISQDSDTSLSVMNGLISAVTGNGETGFTADKASGSSFLLGGGSSLAIAKNSIKFDDKNVLTEDSIVQSTGTATDKVMSQKTITDELNKKANSSDIPTQLSQLSEDETHRVVTDTEKGIWNGKSDFNGDYNSLTNKPTIPTKTSELTNDSDFATTSQIPDTSGFVPNTRTINSKALSSNISLSNKDVGALPDYTINISHQTAGNPRIVKFVSVNYASAATCFKMGAMTCHDNGSSYQFLTDMLIAVTTSGVVTANIYKFAQSSIGSVDGVARYTGDVFYVNDTTNKIVDFYILCGQYSSSQFTPITKVGSTTIAYVTQYSGTATYYSSGTKTWANGCGTTYARLSDIPTKTSQLTNDSDFATVSDIPNVTQTTGTSTENVMSQDAVTKELTAITTALSNKFSNHAQSAYDCNTCYDEGVYLIANGSNCPSGSQYGSLFVMPYRKPTGNAKPDFAVQIFIPNGDDGSKPNSMFYRTSLTDSWNAWQEAATTDAFDYVIQRLNKKADLYKWTNINVTYDVSSTGTHTIDISSVISGWKPDAVYEVVWIMEAYCADVAYLKAYTDMFSNNYSDQRFSANGRQGGRIYTLPCHRYLYYNITTRALNPCKGAVVAYRRLY